MAARKVFLGPVPSHPKLDRLLEEARKVRVTTPASRASREFCIWKRPGLKPDYENLVRDTAKRLRIS